MTPEAEVDLLERMCSIYSPPGEEGEIASYLVDRMGGLGWNSYIDEAGNAVGEYGDGPETIMLLGHMDTVPGFIPVEIRDGLLYGRGAVDAKGPLAAFVCAAARNAAASGAGMGAGTGAGRRRRIVVVGAAGEETDESPGAGHLARSSGRPDFCIIGEPGGWSSVTIGYRGRLAVEAVVRQPVGHPASGRPSVVETAVDLWKGIAEWARTEAAAAGPSGTGPAVAGEGGVRRGGVRSFERIGVVLKDIRRQSDYFQESAMLSMDFRLPPGVAPGRLSAELTARFPAAEFQFRGGQPAWRGGKGTPLVRAFINAIREQGGNPGFKLKLGTSDMNVVGPAWDCPIVAFGPGDSSLDHTPGERLCISEYQSSIAILSRVLETL